MCTYLTVLSGINRFGEDSPFPHCRLRTNHDMKYFIITIATFSTLSLLNPPLLNKCSIFLYMAGKINELAFNHKLSCSVFPEDEIGSFFVNM